MRIVKNNNLIPICKAAFILLCSLSASTTMWAQTEQRSTCARTLQLAQSVYQRGEIHRVPALLKGCLNTRGKSGFTKQERIDALKILTLSHIYREDPEEADNAMLKLLNTDHFFKINEAIDPKEFIALYKTFRTYSLFSLGAKIGPIFVFPNTNELFYGSTTDNTRSRGSYSPIVGFQAGLAFDIPLFKKPGEKLAWVAAPELRYTNSIFSYNTYLTKSEQTNEDNSTIEAIITQHKIQLDLIMHYKIGKSAFNPYVGFGPSIGYLLSSNAQLETQFISTNNLINGPPINFTPNLNAINFDLVASFGGFRQFGGVLITFDVRYQYGLINVPKKKSRINTTAALDYGYVLNNFTQSSIMINLGFSIPIFVPKKLAPK